MVDSVSRFTATVADYVKYRPGYPPELFTFISSFVRNNEEQVIAELGAGTGIFTRLLAQQPYVKKIYAIEPNDSMREAAASDKSINNEKIHFMNGTAETTGLSSRSVDIVIGAQCFHWFDLAVALPEIERIVNPGSWCFAVWNDRLEEGFNVDLERILLTYSTPYGSLRRPNDTIQELKHLLPAGAEFVVKYKQELTLETLIGRMASTSYVAHGVDNKQAFNDALTEAFRRHQNQGYIQMLYHTRVFYWRTPSKEARL